MPASFLPLPFSQKSKKLMMLLSLFLLLDLVVGCVPMRGTQPLRTWHPNDPEATCTPESLLDPTSARWSEDGRAVLESKLAKNEPVIVSALGCHVEVLGRCHAPSAPSANAPSANAATTEEAAKKDDSESTTNNVTLAKSLEGECTGATHVVRSLVAPRTAGAHVHFSALSLAGFPLTGTWRGSMRQPDGPYEVYNATLELVQEGDRVSGITRLGTIDGEYWGDLRFEGRLEGNVVLFADAEIIDDNLGLFLGWCLKGGYMIVDPRDESLRGPWKASFCAPGTMELHFIGENRHNIAQTTPATR